VPVSVGVAVLTVAAIVGPVIATAGPSEIKPAVQVPGGVVSRRLSMNAALSYARSP
jgi:hypothetical protein